MSAKITGSRPLCVASHRGKIYYGEYRGNSSGTPVSVWRGNADGSMWEEAWTFDHVRHIHGVFEDPYSDGLWATTGDDDQESAIWVSYDGFKTIDRVLGGSQKARAVQLVFTKEWVYFGTDAPNEKNAIRRFRRDGSLVEDVFTVDGPVFYGSKVSGWVFFSTVCEPSKVNNTKFVQLVGTRDGLNWHEMLRLDKDPWSMKYFQYGQILFPQGLARHDCLWVSPYATTHDQCTLKIPLASLDELV